MTDKVIKPWKGKVPWGPRGLKDYTNDSEGGGSTEWKANEVTRLHLKLKWFYRGRSASGVIWQDANNPEIEYPMRASCLEDLMKRGSIIDGRTDGLFTVTKAGANFSLKYVG